MSIRIKDIYGNNEIVKGRADWALGYGTEKSDRGAILIIVEAKHYESAAVGTPQLLVYMAGVYERKRFLRNYETQTYIRRTKARRRRFLRIYETQTYFRRNYAVTPSKDKTT